MQPYNIPGQIKVHLIAGDSGVSGTGCTGKAINNLKAQSPGKVRKAILLKYNSSRSQTTASAHFEPARPPKRLAD